MLLITILSYKMSKQHFLSPTFLSAISFTLISLEYYFFMNRIGRDISITLCCLIVLSEIMVALGEYLAERFIIVKKSNVIKNKHADNFIIAKKLQVSKNRTYILTLIMLLVAYARIAKLTDSAGVKELVTAVSTLRYSVARGGISYGALLAIMYYFSQFISYIYAFLFVYCLVIEKKMKIYLLLPVISYSICIISTTSRTEYIKLVCAFLTAFFVCNILCERRKINWIKLGFYSASFVCFFLWYGFSVRGITFNGINSIIDNIVAYSCASLYGMDEYLKNPWAKNEIWGAYTLRNIYAIIGKDVNIGYEPTYFMLHGKSNIYSSLAFLIQDYGIMGMFIVRFFTSYIVTKIQKYFLMTPYFTRRYYFLFIAICHNIYIFLMSPIGEKAYLFYLYPKYFAELIVGGILAFIGMRFAYITSNERLVLKSMFRIGKEDVCLK